MKFIKSNYLLLINQICINLFDILNFCCQLEFPLIAETKNSVNPTLTQGIINIETEVKAIRLYDLNGRNTGKWFNTRQIDISDRSAGIYLLQLNNPVAA